MLDGLTERALESRRIRQRRPESEQFKRCRSGVVEHQQTIAQTVRDTLRVPARDRRWRRCGPAWRIGEKIGGAVHSGASLFGLRLSEATARRDRKQLCMKAPR